MTYKGKRTNYQKVKSESNGKLIFFLIVAAVIVILVLTPALQANAPRALGY